MVTNKAGYDTTANSVVEAEAAAQSATAMRVLLAVLARLIFHKRSSRYSELTCRASSGHNIRLQLTSVLWFPQCYNYLYRSHPKCNFLASTGPQWEVLWYTVFVLYSMSFREHFDVI